MSSTSSSIQDLRDLQNLWADRPIPSRVVQVRKLSNRELKETCRRLIAYHHQYLAKYGVKLPNFKDRDNLNLTALTLIYLAYNYPYNQVVSKENMIKFAGLYGKSSNDIQALRHLSAQSGWFIATGERKDIKSCDEDYWPKGGLKSAEYWLYHLEYPYPNFTKGRRTASVEGWGNILDLYKHRCATCGSKEGEPSYQWPSVITKLQQAHMDPRKPMKKGNIIPQCVSCNEASKDWWVYDEKGRVIKIANPAIVKRSDLSVRKKIFELLTAEFSEEIPAK